MLQTQLLAVDGEVLHPAEYSVWFSWLWLKKMISSTNDFLPVPSSAMKSMLSVSLLKSVALPSDTKERGVP